jgi:hypothetical protein
MTFDFAEATAALERGPSVLRALVGPADLDRGGPWRSMLGVLDRVDR